MAAARSTITTTAVVIGNSARPAPTRWSGLVFAALAAPQKHRKRPNSSCVGKFQSWNHFSLAEFSRAAVPEIA
jgi:hypothetical protein